MNFLSWLFWSQIWEKGNKFVLDHFFKKFVGKCFLLTAWESVSPLKKGDRVVSPAHIHALFENLKLYFFWGHFDDIKHLFELTSCLIIHPWHLFSHSLYHLVFICFQKLNSRVFYFNLSSHIFLRLIWLIHKCINFVFQIFDF